MRWKLLVSYDKILHSVKFALKLIKRESTVRTAGRSCSYTGWELGLSFWCKSNIAKTITIRNSRKDISLLWSKSLRKYDIYHMMGTQMAHTSKSLKFYTNIMANTVLVDWSKYLKFWKCLWIPLIKQVFLFLFT